MSFHTIREDHFGAEEVTRSEAASRGEVFIRDPKSGHGTTTSPHSLKYMREKGHPMAGDPGPDEQQSMFSPDEVKNPPHHSLSPHQFAAQKDVWWHGKYGDDMTNDSYKEGYEHFPDHVPNYDEDGEEEDDKSGYQGIHFGTKQAATDRLKHLGPGRPQSEDDYGPEGHDERVPGRFFPVTLNKENMGQGGTEVIQDQGHDWRLQMGYDEPAQKGVLYKNEAEDQGSISATVPERTGRNGHFFKTWNDHVTEAHAAGVSVHPMLLHAAQRGAEHTGEDYVHPDEAKHALTPIGAPDQGALFQAYGPHWAGAKAKYLDHQFKDTLGPNIKVPSQRHH